MIKTALMCLSMAVYHESRGEPIKGQYAVAEVVLNRADKRNLDVCEVIYEKGQFQNVNKWKMPSEYNQNWQIAMDVAYDSLLKKTNYTNGATFFKVKKLKKHGKHIVIGNHAFY